MAPQEVLNLHLKNTTDISDTSGVEDLYRRIGERLGLAQSYEDWGDVGYHFLIGEDGRIYQGRSLSNLGSHVVGKNRGNLGIAVVGDYSSKPLNSSQQRALEHLLRILSERYDITQPTVKRAHGPVYTHGEFDPRKANELGGARKQIDALTRRIWH